jgi:hypothetical protein
MVSNVHVVRVIEQCCFNSTPDSFNGQTANIILKPPKVIESRTYSKKPTWIAIEKNTSVTPTTAQQSKSVRSSFLIIALLFITDISLNSILPSMISPVFPKT